MILFPGEKCKHGCDLQLSNKAQMHSALVRSVTAALCSRRHTSALAAVGLEALQTDLDVA